MGGYRIPTRSYVLYNFNLLAANSGSVFSGRDTAVSHRRSQVAARAQHASRRGRLCAMAAKSPRGTTKCHRTHPTKPLKPRNLKQNLSWAFRSSLLTLLLLAVIALASFGAESRRLQAAAPDATETYPNVDAFTAVVPKPNITIRVDESRGGRRSISSSSSSSSSGGSVAGPADNASNDVTSTLGTGATGSGGEKGDKNLDADLVGPVVSGDVSGLFQHLAPNSSAPVSAYSLRIDDMAGLVTPKGYPLEQHVVVTGDGYKLGTFRIPYGRSGRGVVKRPPVLLIHGISLASTCWVINQPTESLAFILADRGYDVWMMNTRGNTFSREHVLYRDTQSLFWRFSVPTSPLVARKDEMAKWDLRETIKYIQDVTGISKVGLVGHSQGGTIALMALSDDPWLADSVSVLVALGPCAYVQYMTSVVLKNFCRQANTSEIFKLLPSQELIYMSVQMQQTYLNGVCQMPGTMLTCLTTMEGIFGASRRITAAQYRRYWQIWPSSTSLGNAMQWAEIYNEPKPRFFHSGYGPEYKLENVKAPIVMVSGGSDVLAAMEDVAEQKRRLRKVLRKELHVPDYSHMDFIWDTGAVRTVYPIVLETLAESFA